MTRRTQLELVSAVLALATIVALAAIAVGGDDAVPHPRAAASAPTPSVSPSPVTLAKVGGVFLAIPDRRITDPRLLPYPFMSPTPAPTDSVLDGTYLRTLTLGELGGARIAMPYRCLRCIPYRIDAGVSTLILTRGAYYVHHQLSGFRTMGSFVVDGDRLTLFNDPNCPQTPGTYRFELTAHALRFTVIEDDCAYGGERPDDLSFSAWTHVSACVRRIQDLWPGEVAC